MRYLPDFLQRRQTAESAGTATEAVALSPAARRNFLCACGCGLAITAAGASLLSASTEAEAAAGGTLLKIGHLPAGCVQHLLLAKALGLFEKAGLNIELTQFNGPADSLQALVAGKLDAIHGPWTTTIAAYAEGAKDLRIIGGSGQAGIELVARKGTVKNVQELIAAAGKGLRVGTLRLDTLELVGYGTLAKHGKSYDDYKMTFFPSMVGMGEALANGSLDVCTLAQPYAESVVRQAGGVYLNDSTAVWGPEAADCVVTTRVQTGRAQADTLRAYLRVLKESATYLKSNYEAALDKLQPMYGAPREVLAAALKRQVPHPVIGKAGVQGLRDGGKYLVELGYFKVNPVDQVLDLRYQPA